MNKSEYFVAAQRQEYMRGLMRRAVAALENVGIRPVLLKGFGLARLYPQPYMRSWGDIDLYVGKADYHKGAAALRKAFPEAALFDSEEDWYKHYNLTFYEPVATAIEMHRISASFMHPRDEKQYSKLEEQGLVQHPIHQTDGEDSWWEPEWKFNVLYVFYHSWEHWTHRSANMRQIQDLAMLLTVGKPDNVTYSELEQYLTQALKALHLTEAWKLYAYLVVNEYNITPSQCPMYTSKVADRAKALKASILQPEPPAPKTPAPKNVLLRKIHTFRQRLREAKRIAQYEPTYARHMVRANIAQSWTRFLRGENTRHWE